MTATPHSGAADDGAARERALDPSGSFIVQAPAGSGKTELLVQRMLVLLATVERPEEVIAVTFTRKAAAEMRHRIVHALHRAQGPRPEAAHEARTWELARAVLKRDAACGWGLLEAPERLRLLTYDSLALLLCRASPLAAGLAPDVRLVEQPEPLYRAAALALLAHAEDDGDLGRAVRRVLDHFDGRADLLLEQITQMLACRDQWLGYTGGDHGARADDIDALLEQVHDAGLAAARAAIGDERLERLLALTRYAHDNLCAAGKAPDWRRPQARSAGEMDLADWHAVCAQLLTQDDEWRRPRGISKTIGFPTERDGPPGAGERKQELIKILGALADSDAALAALRRVLWLPSPGLDADQRQVLADLLTTMRYAAAELKRVFAERGQCDFIEVAACARSALQGPDGPEALLLKLDARIRHLLLDEFQDTSPGQLALVELLTSGWEPGDGRTLFAVGDPMQSIYRFRQADVRLFLQVRDQGVGGHLKPAFLQLTRNFRSRPGIVAWVNQTFAGIFPDADDPGIGAVRYSPSLATRDDVHGEVRWHLREGSAADEARDVLRVLREELDASPDSRIAILVRARTDLPEILAALRREEIAFQGVGLDTLQDHPVAQDLRALSRAIAHPADRLCWLAVLRAPWAGLPLADLLAVARAVPPQAAIADWLEARDFAGLSGAGRRILSRIRETLLPVLAARGRQPFDALVFSAWAALGGVALHRGKDRLVVDAFLDCLREAAPSGDLAAFEVLDQLLAVRGIDDPAAPGCRVQVMTMHKAKGLQFDVVLLPGLSRAPRRGDTPPLRWAAVRGPDGGMHTVVVPVHARGSEADAAFRYLGWLDRQADDCERARLLYVAATRARERLHLFARRDRNRDGDWARPRSGSLLALFGDAIDGVPVAPADDARSAEDAAPPPTMLRRLPPDFALPAWPQAPGAPAAVEALPDAPPDESGEGALARRVGELFHAFAQACAEQAEPPGHLPPDLEERFARALAHAGVGPGLREEGARRLVEAARRMLASERGRWLLGRHSDAAAELEVGSADGLRRIDRCFVDDAGVRWIVDYKTSAPQPGEDVESFLDRETHRYREQLERYARLLAAIEDRPIRCALYFPMIDGWREWEPPAG